MVNQLTVSPLLSILYGRTGKILAPVLSYSLVLAFHPYRAPSTRSDSKRSESENEDFRMAEGNDRNSCLKKISPGKSCSGEDRFRGASFSQVREVQFEKLPYFPLALAASSARNLFNKLCSVM